MYTMIFRMEGKDDTLFTVEAANEEEALEKLNTLEFYAKVDGDIACAMEEGGQNIYRSIDDFCEDNIEWNCGYEIHEH